VGKSTLLNTLLNEDRAIVSEIPGTTRDSVEDEITIGGINFRFIDTAGIRETKDIIEGLGIQRTFKKMEHAQVVVLLLDASKVNSEKFSVKSINAEIEKIRNRFPQKSLMVIANKIDTLTEKEVLGLKSQISNLNLLSAKTGQGVDELKASLLNFINTGVLRNNETIISNTRHYDALLKALEEIDKVQEGIDSNLSGDLLAIDIRQALYHLGEITGAITNDDLLGNIFANFCIGK